MAMWDTVIDDASIWTDKSRPPNARRFELFDLLFDEAFLFFVAGVLLFFVVLSSSSSEDESSLSSEPSPELLLSSPEDDEVSLLETSTTTSSSSLGLLDPVIWDFGGGGPFGEELILASTSTALVELVAAWVAVGGM